MKPRSQNLLVLAVTAGLVAVAVVLLNLPGAQRGSAPVRSDDPMVRIMAVGDSITQGAAGDLTWRWYLDRHLRDQAIDFDLVGPRETLGSAQNRGISPERYADPDFDRDHAAWWGDSFVLRRTGEPRALVAQHRPDVVVLALGTNDLTLWHATGKETLERAGTWISEAREAKPDLDVVVLALPGIGGQFDVYNAGLNELAARTSTEDARTVAVPWPADYRASVWPGDGGDTRDGVHPNSAGQAKIAHAVADALAELGIGTAPTGGFEVQPDAPDGPSSLPATGTPSPVVPALPDPATPDPGLPPVPPAPPAP